MARPAQGFKVRIIIGTPMCFRFDVVNGPGFNGPASSQAVLTQTVITLENTGSPDIPLTAIAALMAGPALLMLLPPFIGMVGTVA